jgi:hypothetical protein
MENVWVCLRTNKLSAGVWNNYDEVLAASDMTETASLVT